VLFRSWILASVWERPPLAYGRRRLRLKLARVWPETIADLRELREVAGAARCPALVRFLGGAAEALAALQRLSALRVDALERAVGALRFALSTRGFGELTPEHFRMLALQGAPLLAPGDRAALADAAPSLLSARDGAVADAVARLTSGESAGAVAADVAALLAARVPLPLDQLCAALVRKAAWRPLVDLCLGYAEAPAAIDDRVGHRRKAFAPILENLGGCLQFALESTDRDFSRCLYEKLLETDGTLARAMAAAGPHLKSFIRERCPRELGRYYESQGRYSAAARFLLSRAVAEEALFLEERMAMLEKAVALAFESSQVREAAAAKLRTAQIQRECARRTRLNPAYDEYFDIELLSAQEIYAECAELGFWDLVIRLFACARIESECTENAVSVAWRNVFTRQLWERPLDDVRRHLVDLLADFEGVGLFQIVMAIEDFRMNRRADATWAVEVLIAAKLPRARLAAVYRRALESNALAAKCRADFALCLAVL
jgi:hypothetical protein